MDSAAVSAALRFATNDSSPGVGRFQVIHSADDDGAIAFEDSLPECLPAELSKLRGGDGSHPSYLACMAIDASTYVAPTARVHPDAG